MSKNIKMLFALLATAAIMVTASFAGGNTVYTVGDKATLIAGSAEHAKFKLSEDINLGTSSDQSILQAAAYKSGDEFQQVTLDLNSKTISADSSDQPLFKETSMKMYVSDDNGGGLLMQKPLFGVKNSAAEVDATLTLEQVGYVNDATSADTAFNFAFTGSKSYDVNVVLDNGAAVEAAYLVDQDTSADLSGYKFTVKCSTSISADLKGVKEGKITMDLGANLGEAVFTGTGLTYAEFTALIDNIDEVNVEYNDEDDIFMVTNAKITVETAGSLDEALASTDVKTIVLSGDVTVSATSADPMLMLVNGRKVLDVNSGDKLTLDYVGFFLTDKTDFDVHGAITLSGDVVSNEITGPSYKGSLFTVDSLTYKETHKLTICSDAVLTANKYFDLYGETTTNYEAGELDVEIEDGAIFYFGDNTEEKAAVAAYLANGKTFKAVPNMDGYYYATDADPTPSSSSSSGCNAGFAALALLALAFVPSKKSK